MATPSAAQFHNEQFLLYFATIKEVNMKQTPLKATLFIVIAAISCEFLGGSSHEMNAI